MSDIEKSNASNTKLEKKGNSNKILYFAAGALGFGVLCLMLLWTEVLADSSVKLVLWDKWVFLLYIFLAGPFVAAFLKKKSIANIVAYGSLGIVLTVSFIVFYFRNKAYRVYITDELDAADVTYLVGKISPSGVLVFIGLDQSNDDSIKTQMNSKKINQLDLDEMKKSLEKGAGKENVEEIKKDNSLGVDKYIEQQVKIRFSGKEYQGFVLEKAPSEAALDALKKKYSFLTPPKKEQSGKKDNEEVTKM
ncbi:hypothetical protein ENBRE01_0210 [Enteropsectra breve]|nr:hypothetical protein ENBRE01_0210 [Enteropsectra breve]